MKRPALNKEIIKLLERSKEKHGKILWYKKHQFYGKFEDWLPETVGRTLRDLAENGTIENGYYKGKYAHKLSMYRLVEKI